VPEFLDNLGTNVRRDGLAPDTVSCEVSNYGIGTNLTENNILDHT